MEKSDIGKSTLLIKKETCSKGFHGKEWDNNYKPESWEDLRLDAFEGDESNYWNIE